jgi:hypothetical protein
MTVNFTPLPWYGITVTGSSPLDRQICIHVLSLTGLATPLGAGTYTVTVVLHGVATSARPCVSKAKAEGHPIDLRCVVMLSGPPDCLSSLTAVSR